MTEPERAPAHARRATAVDHLIGAIDRLSQVGAVIAVCLLLAAVVVICEMVFVRYVLAASAIWQHEFVTFSLIGATFIGAPYVLLTGGHVNVDLVPLYLGPRGRRLLALLALLISLAFCTILAAYGFDFWHEAFVNDWRSESVWRPPLWIPYGALPLGMGLLALQCLAEILALLSGRRRPLGQGPEPR
jgi:TRAP-type C4-dicarboxylate transport system permease small subunit